MADLGGGRRSNTMILGKALVYRSGGDLLVRDDVAPIIDVENNSRPAGSPSTGRRAVRLSGRSRVVLNASGSAGRSAVAVVFASLIVVLSGSSVPVSSFPFLRRPGPARFFFPFPCPGAFGLRPAIMAFAWCVALTRPQPEPSAVVHACLTGRGPAAKPVPEAPLTRLLRALYPCRWLAGVHQSAVVRPWRSLGGGVRC